MKILIIMMYISFSVWSAEDFKSLSCSKSQTGTQIFYINGVLTSDGKAKDTAEEIFTSIKTANFKKNIDINEKVFVDYLYNNSEEFGLDLIQTIGQKIAETGQLPTAAGIGGFLFKRGRYCVANPVICAGVGLGVAGLLIKQTYISNSDIMQMSDLIAFHLNSNYKVIVVSHSQGNIYANQIYSELLRRGISKDHLDKYFGNLQVATPVSSIKAKNHRVYLSLQDPVINELRSSFPTVLRGNYTFSNLNPSNLSNHYMSESYLSNVIDVHGPKQGKGIVKRTASDVFLENLEEVAWMLANNDESCCDGRDGRFYRKDYKSDPQKGFLEKTVNVAKNVNLEMDETSQLCGEVILESSFSGDKIKFENTQIYGDIPTKLKGNIFLVNTVMNPFEEGTVLNLDGNGNDPIYVEETHIAGSPYLQGSMILSDLDIYGNGKISGTPFYVTSTQSWFVPHITNVVVNGGEIKGVYGIERDLYMTDIDGSAVNTPTDEFNFMHILPDPLGHTLTEGNLKGIAYLAGRVDGNVTINGQVISSHYSGVYLSADSTLHQFANVNGAASLTNGSIFNHTWNANQLTPSGNVGHLMNAKLYGTSLSGAPVVYSSTISGGSMSNYPFVQGCTLTAPIIFGNANISGEATTGVTYGWGYNTTPLYENEVQLILNRSLSDEFTEKNRLKMIEVREKFSSL